MAQLNRVERLTPLALEVVHGRIAGLPQVVEDIENLAGRHAVDLQLAQDVDEGFARFELGAGALCNDPRETFGELACLDQGCVCVVDEVLLGVAAERRERRVELLQMAEVADSGQHPILSPRVPERQLRQLAADRKTDIRFHSPDQMFPV